MDTTEHKALIDFSKTVISGGIEPVKKPDEPFTFDAALDQIAKFNPVNEDEYPDEAEPGGLVSFMTKPFPGVGDIEVVVSRKRHLRRIVSDVQCESERVNGAAPSDVTRHVAIQPAIVVMQFKLGLVALDLDGIDIEETHHGSGKFEVRQRDREEAFRALLRNFAACYLVATQNGTHVVGLPIDVVTEAAILESPLLDEKHVNLSDARGSWDLRVSQSWKHGRLGNGRDLKVLTPVMNPTMLPGYDFAVRQLAPVRTFHELMIGIWGDVAVQYPGDCVAHTDEQATDPAPF